MAFKPTAEKAVFHSIFGVLNCHVFGADDYRTCTKVNFQNAVTFVLVKLDTKFNVQNS